MRYVRSSGKALASGVKRIFGYFRLAIGEFLDDNGAHLSASISYYLLFSIFPLLLAVVAILVTVVQETAAQDIIDWLQTIVPEQYFSSVESGVESAVAYLLAVRSVSTIIALIGLLWAGTSVFNVIRKTLNVIWGITIPRPFFRERLMEIIMVAVVGIIVLSSFVLSVGLDLIQGYVQIPGFTGAITSGALGAVISGSIMFLIFIFLYRFTPYVKLRWRDVWFEALLAAISFEVIKYIFVAYIFARIGDVDNIYGSSIGIVIAALLWAYVSSIAFLFCCEMASLRYRGVMLWGRGRIETTEGPLPSFLESRVESTDDHEIGGEGQIN
jgi:membrane protein